MRKAKPVDGLVNAHLLSLFLDSCFQAEDQKKDQFQGVTEDGSMEKAISDTCKLKETEIRSTILGYFLQSKVAVDGTVRVPYNTMNKFKFGT